MWSLLAKFIWLVASIAYPGPPAEATAPNASNAPVALAAELGVPYDRYEITDKLGRTVTFYVSQQTHDAPPRPFVLTIQGSGCSSVFSRMPDGRIGGGFQNIVRKTCKDRARVMVVEKPGVEFLDDPPSPGTCEGCSEEFKFRHEFNRWALDWFLAGYNAVQSARAGAAQ